MFPLTVPGQCLTPPPQAETIGELHPCSKWACGAAGSALPWHGRGHRFDPDQVHQSQLNRSVKTLAPRLVGKVIGSIPIRSNNTSPRPSVYILQSESTNKPLKISTYLEPA